MYLIQDRQDTEKVTLKLRAHEKSLAAVSGQKTAGQGTGSISIVSTHCASARSRHNKKQCQLYQKRLKARKVQQREQAKAAAIAPGAITVPKQGQ